MKTITIKDLMSFCPCYPLHKIKAIAGNRVNDAWSALDILALDNVPAEDRLWVVLREKLIDAPILHEFACRIAERALSRIPNPDPRSIAGIAAKRAWLRGEISGKELLKAYAAAYAAADAARAAADAARAAYAAARAAADAAYAAARAAAYAAAAAAYAAADAARAAYAAARAAAYAARAAAYAAYAAADAAAHAAAAAARESERKEQIVMLVKMLKEA